MPWVKVPKDNYPIFRAALPDRPRSEVISMFGGLCATVNGNMACGLFGRSVMVRLGDGDRVTALALDGSTAFDPMGRGARHGEDKIVLPETVLDDRDELKSWLQRSLDHAATLPKKAAKTRSPAKAKAKSTIKAAPAKRVEKAKKAKNAKKPRAKNRK